MTTTTTMTRTAEPFLALLAQKLCHAAVLFAALAVVVTVVETTGPRPVSGVHTQGAGAAALATFTDADRTGVRLARRYGCWGGTVGRQQPADMTGRLPGHVVVQVAGAVVYTGSRRLVGLALEDAVGEPQPGIKAYAFCR